MKSSLSHLIASLVVCALVLFAYGAWYAIVSGKSAAVAALQNQVDAKARAVAKLATARAALAELSGDEAAIAGYFVADTGVVSFIEDLERRGETAGATVDVLSVSPEKTANQPMLALSVSAKGSFDSVMRSVGSFEYAPYDLSVISLIVNKDAGSGNWRADLKLLVGSSASSTPVVMQ